MHVLILGMTLSGKTSLAKQLASHYKRRGVPTLVLDPMSDPKWDADYKTKDPDEFMETFYNSRNCAVFIDEAGDMVGRYNTVMQQTATKGRHWGHRVHFITQRGVQLASTVRDQCSELFLFTTSLKDCKIHADEWNKPELTQAFQLPQLEYYHCTRFEGPHKNILSFEGSK